MTQRPAESTTEPWFDQAFGDLYLKVYAHRDQRDAQEAVACAIRELGIERAHTILDLCCGAGRHMQLLLEQGFNVSGLDRSAALLAEARRVMPHASLTQGDMRELPFPDARFDRVLNLFTSFGYFDDPADDLRVLSEIRRVLKPGGRAMLDHMNPTYVKANLVPESSETRDGFLISATRSIVSESATSQRVEKTVRIERGGKLLNTYRESVRLFEPQRLDELAQAAGLRVSRRLGSFAGESFDPVGSARQIALLEVV